MVLSENVLVNHLKMGLLQTLPQIVRFDVLRRRGGGDEWGAVGISGGADSSVS